MRPHVVLTLTMLVFGCGGWFMGFITHDPIVALVKTIADAQQTMTHPEVADPPPMADCPHNLPVIQPAVAAE